MERKVVAYSVVHGPLELVERKVNELIKNGWEPIGNIGTLDGQIFHQAIVKKESVTPGIGANPM
jgi:hypothetical protein